MSWSRRAVLALALGCAACGYTPAYGPGRDAGSLQGRLAFADPSTRDQFLLLQQMERRLGRSSAGDYRLDYFVTVASEAQGISVSGARTRYHLIGQVAYSLVETETGQVVLSGQATDFTAYSAAGTTIATFAAQRDAQERLMVTLADQVTTRLLASDLQ